MRKLFFITLLLMGVFNVFAQSKTDTCRLIDKSVDDFTGKITFGFSDINGISLIKTINKGKTNYYLSLTTYGNTFTAGEKGVSILFEDKSKMFFPKEDIDVKLNSSSWDYSAFIELTGAQVLSLTKKKLLKFRLYIYDRDVGDKDASKLQSYFSCIKSSR